MTKAYRRRDRAWRECISLEEFQCMARETVGRERPNKEADDWCKNLFGKVASPGVKHPLRRKQREEAIRMDLERTEESRRDGGHNSRKQKRTVDSSHHPQDRRSHHRESNYSENVDRVIEGGPPRAVLPQQRGPVSPIAPVTPPRPRLSRRLAPFGSMTNVTNTDPTTPPKSPLNGRGRNRLEFGELGKERGLKDSEGHLGGNLDPYVDEDGYEWGKRVSLETNNPFVALPLAPPLSPPTTAPRRERIDLRGDTGLHTSGDSPTKVSIDAQTTAEQTTPLVSRLQSPSNPPQISLGRQSLSIVERSSPLHASNSRIESVPPPASPPGAPGIKDTSTGMKRKREEDAHSHSKKVILARSPPSARKVPGRPRDLKPSETWGPNETTFMEEPHLTRDASRSKTRRGDMSVDAIKARLVRATSTLQILPSQKSDEAVRSLTAVGRTDPVMREKTLDGDIEPCRRKAGSSISTFNIPAPFPPGTSGPGSTPGRPSHSDRVAAYHGADRYYSSRPPSSATSPPLPKDPELSNEGGRLFTSAPGVGTKSGEDDIHAGQPDQPTSEASKKGLGRFTSFVLAPQQLLFTDTAVGKLMSTSVVWFARDIHVPEPPYRPSSLQLVPRLSEVSQLESLLVACGWHRKKSFTSKQGIERGVVFVDYEEQSDVQAVVKTHWVAQQCENAYRLATQYHSPAERGMKPIWVMDARVLRWEMLRMMKPGDVLDTLDEFVLWREE
jgi:hypothetical protein